MPQRRPKKEILDAAREAFERHGSKVEAAKELGIPRTTLQQWLRFVDDPLPEPVTPTPKGRKTLSLASGTIIVGSDAHRWPGPFSTGQRAFIYFIKQIKPKVVVVNGDVLDFNVISRHPPIGWESAPTVQEEIEAAHEWLTEAELAAPKGCKKVWTLGNHDARFETKLAQVAPEFAGIKGIHINDHFPNWTSAWSLFVNDNLVIKHRFKGGIHATHNNTLWSGLSIVTGHLHSAKVTPVTDYNGTRYGVDTGCLADIYAEAFQSYLEDSPRNWRSGFAVLTIKDGALLPPELVLVVDQDHVTFRGEVIKV